MSLSWLHFSWIAWRFVSPNKRTRFMGVGKIFSRWATRRFYPLETKKTTFFAENLKIPRPPSPTPMTRKASPASCAAITALHRSHRVYWNPGWSRTPHALRLFAYDGDWCFNAVRPWLACSLLPPCCETFLHCRLMSELAVKESFSVRLALSTETVCDEISFMLSLRLFLKRSSKNYYLWNVPEQPVTGSQHQPALVRSTSNRSLPAIYVFIAWFCLRTFQIDRSRFFSDCLVSSVSKLRVNNVYIRNVRSCFFIAKSFSVLRQSRGSFRPKSWLLVGDETSSLCYVPEANSIDWMFILE